MHARRHLGVHAMTLIACTSTTPAADPKPSTTMTEAKAPLPVAAKPPAPGSDADCEARIGEYLAHRSELARCEQDSDCAEMWPGLCPHGPYYVHRESDVASVIAKERAIVAACSVPDCEPPMELGIAHCEHGTCKRGRTPPASDDHKSCWDYRETYLEPTGSADAETEPQLRGITPHLVIAPATAGTLTLELDWPSACSDCRLLISEHNSGMSRLVTPVSSSKPAKRNGADVRREHLELAVKPGPYHLVGTAATRVHYSVRATLHDDTGALGKVTRHGTAWQRLCEG